MVKLIFSLALIALLAVFGPGLWEKAQQRVIEVVNPGAQKALIIEALKKDFAEIEQNLSEVRENIDNPNFDSRTQVESSLKLLQESKQNVSGLEKIEEREDSLVNKTFENIKDLGKQVQGLISQSPEKESSKAGADGECRCNP